MFQILSQTHTLISIHFKANGCFDGPNIICRCQLCMWVDYSIQNLNECTPNLHNFCIFISLNIFVCVKMFLFCLFVCVLLVTSCSSSQCTMVTAASSWCWNGQIPHWIQKHGNCLPLVIGCSVATWYFHGDCQGYRHRITHTDTQCSRLAWR